MARRRSWLYLGGTLSSIISVMMVMRLGTWFFGGRALMFQVLPMLIDDPHLATQLCVYEKLAYQSSVLSTGTKLFISRYDPTARQGQCSMPRAECAYDLSVK